MGKQILRAPLGLGHYDEILLKINGKMLNEAGINSGELMTVEINDGRITIEKHKDGPVLEELAETHAKPKSFYDGGYHGYKVGLKLDREAEYEPAYLSNSNQVYEFLKPLQYEPRESVLAVMLNAKNGVVGVHEAARGGIENALLTPYDIIQPALFCNSTRVLISHNHSSGDPEPSKPDFDITEKIKKAFDIMRMDLLDHIIIGHEKYISFRDKGYLV